MCVTNSVCLKRRTAVLDQCASVDADFMNHIFDFGIEKLLITDQGKTVATVEKHSQSLLPDQIQCRKVVVLPCEFSAHACRGLPLSGLVQMLTEGGFALALETRFHPQEHLLMIPSTEKFDHDDGDVIVLEGTEQMHIGYQLYCADPSLGQKLLGGPFRDFWGYARAEIKRIVQVRNDLSTSFGSINRGFHDSHMESSIARKESKMDRNSCIDLDDRIVAVGADRIVHGDFLPLLCQHDPRAVLFCSDTKPEAIMVRKWNMFCGGRFLPETEVPIPRQIYPNPSLMDSLPLAPLVRMVNQAQVYFSFEFNDDEEKVLLAPYRHEYGLDPGAAIRLQGDDEDCQWLRYLLFLVEQVILPQDGHKSVLSFEQFLDYIKTPEERLAEQFGFNMD